MSSEIVHSSVTNTLLYATQHLQRTFESRVGSEASGSRYPQFDSILQLHAAILEANWEPYEHPDVMSGCQAYRASIPGSMGIVSLTDLSDDETVMLVDYKETGNLSCVVTVEDPSLIEVDFSVLIIGKSPETLQKANPGKTLIYGSEEEREANCWSYSDVVFTVHPGDPVRPSMVKGEPMVTTVGEALRLGFLLAKVESS